MSMFPGAHARVYRNEAGEPIGWDYPSDEEPYDPDDYLPDEAPYGWCPECGEPFDEDDLCWICHDEDVPNEQPIDGRAVESIDPDPTVI